MRVLLICGVLLLSCSKQNNKIELLKNDMHEKSIDLLSDITSDLVIKNVNVNYESSRFYYKLKESLGRERNNEFDIKEIEDTLHSPDAVKIVVDIHQNQYQVGSLILDYQMENFRLKNTLLTEKSVIKQKTELFESLFNGKYIDANKAIEVAKQNGFSEYYGIELINDNFWKKNAYGEKSKITWKIKRKLSGLSFKNEIIKVDAIDGKVLLRYKE